MRKSHLKVIALIGALLTAITGQASIVSNVSTIHISSSNNGWLQISEIVVLDINGVDLALAPNVNTSSSGIGFNGLESNAINGVAPGFCIANDCTPADPGSQAGQGLFHSSSPSGAFFEVSLVVASDIYGLSIFGRTDRNGSYRDIYDVQLRSADSSILFSAINQSADNVSHEAIVLSQVPLPATAWLFVSGIMGLTSFTSRKRN